MIEKAVILIVDDNRESISILQELLVNEGYEIRTESKGENAILSLANQEPDLILLDSNLSGISGFELCCKIKAHESWYQIPVIFLTSVNEESERIKGFNSGAADYLSRPFLREELRVKIKTHISHYHLTKLFKSKGEEYFAINEELKEINEEYSSINEEYISLNAELSNSSEKWSNTFDSITDIITIISPDFDILEINAAGCKALGLDKKDILGKKCYKLVHGLDEPIDGCTCKATLISKTEQVEEIVEMGKYSLITSWPVFNHNSEIIALSHSIKDITKAKQIEQELHKEKSRAEEFHEMYYSLVETSQDLIWRCDLEGRFTYLNPAWEMTHGYKPEEMLGRPFSDFQKPEVFERDSKVFARHLEGNVINGFETSHIRKDGSDVLLVFNVKPLLNKIGKIVGTQGTAYDITDKKIAENKLKENKFLLKESQRIAKIGSYKTDFVAGFWISSEALDSIFGIDKDYIRSVAEWLDIVHPEEKEMLNNYLIKEVIGNRKPFDKEYRITRINDKQTRWVHGLGEVSFDDKGNITTMIGTIQDITDRKLIEIELKNVKDKAEESDRLKTSFLQNMSHEFRTPMNAIIGFSDLIEKRTLTDAKKGLYLQTIKESANDLLAMINDILDISRIESGNVVLFPKNGWLVEMLTEINNFFILSNETHLKKHIQFKLMISENIGDGFICADFSRLKQILLNLVSNAFKFTDTGFIELGCQLNEKDILFFVKDTGIGVPDCKKSLIFDRFRQADESVASRQYGGTGLGLSISKGLVNLMGGMIWVESEENKGSTFWFTIPYIKGKMKSAGSAMIINSSYDWKNKKILIVDDIERNVDYITAIIDDTGAEILSAFSGQSALELFHQNENIDMVLMDIRLPDINGIELTKTMKSYRKDLVVIAQTAYASTVDKQLCLNSGCSDFITKPIKAEHLLRTMNKYFNG